MIKPIYLICNFLSSFKDDNYCPDHSLELQIVMLIGHFTCPWAKYYISGISVSSALFVIHRVDLLLFVLLCIWLLFGYILMLICDTISCAFSILYNSDKGNRKIMYKLSIMIIKIENNLIICHYTWLTFSTLKQKHIIIPSHGTWLHII